MFLCACVHACVCTAQVFGCTEPGADNYNQAATVPTACIYCGELASDEHACTAAGCRFTVGAQPLCEYVAFEVLGCMEVEADNYDPFATVGLADSCRYCGELWTDEPTCVDAGCSFTQAINEIPAQCEHVVYGCTEAEADNYDPRATRNEGCLYCQQHQSDEASCRDSRLGSSQFCNFIPGNQVSAPRCDYVAVGCPDPASDNYNPLATVAACSYCSGHAADAVTCTNAGCTYVEAFNEIPAMCVASPPGGTGGQCEAEMMTCMGDPECLSLASGEEVDTTQCLANTNCAALWTCTMQDNPCAAEILACMADTECAVFPEAGPDMDFGACMANPLCADVMNCLARTWPAAALL